MIGEKAYSERWPFQFDHGALMCPSADEVIVLNPATGRSYALTQAALDSGAGWDADQTILRPGASDELIPELIERGLKLCHVSRP